MRLALVVCAVAFTNASVAQVPICMLNGPTASVAANSVFTLTATCTPTASAYTWTGPGIPSATAVASVLGTAPSAAGTYVFSVLGKNASGPGLIASSTLIVATSGSPPVTPVAPVVPAPRPQAGSIGLLASCSPNYTQPTNLNVAAMTLDSTVFGATFTGTEIFAWSFVAPEAMKLARVEMTSDNYIDGKDFSVSACPGDFATTLPNECVSRLMGSSMLMIDAGGNQQRCHLSAGSTYFVNVQMSYPAPSVVRIRGQAYDVPSASAN